jgi:hypothetical protein
MMLEDMMASSLRFADLVAYPLSPTTAFPATYPMLDPPADVYVDEGAILCSTMLYDSV